MLQLDFLRSLEECERDAIKDDIRKVKESTDKVRKGTYARINLLKQQYIDLAIRLEIIEKHICKNNKDALWTQLIEHP